jgi:hypothetical protein
LFFQIMASTCDLSSEPDSKLYRLLSPTSEHGAVGWLQAHLTTLVISVAVAVGLLKLGAHVGLCLAVASLPLVPSFFCLLAVMVAQTLFFREPPVEDSNRAARRLTSYPQGSFSFLDRGRGSFVVEVVVMVIRPQMMESCGCMS